MQIQTFEKLAKYMYKKMTLSNISSENIGKNEFKKRTAFLFITIKK